MGNTAARDKMRHSSGEDSGPMMYPRGEYSMDDSEEFPPGTFKASSRDDVEPTPRPRTSTITAGEEINPRKLPTVFKWEANAKLVFISGSFDNWKSKIPMVKSHGDFYTIIDLPEGTHQYKYNVDGQWVCDPNEPNVDNGIGSKNNQITVKATDFEVFEALAMDSASTGHSKSVINSDALINPTRIFNSYGTYNNVFEVKASDFEVFEALANDIMDCGRRESMFPGVSGSPPGEYGQFIPPRNTGSGFHHSGPPTLPPHLLQVILNKEIPLHCEPTLLPEPNHVMLNHLYALSIKDGVMVLSATHRYRKKYVTTLLYKPI